MKSSAIAIVGMAGRFPGARNLDEFWRNLRDGVESIRPLAVAELIAAGVAPDVIARPDYVRAAAVLDEFDMFDASFFGFSPKDAAIMDPQHRHFLECAWEALENAGHTAESFDGSIGVFAGSGMNAYLLHNLINNLGLMESAGLFLVRQTGNDKDVLATRVSYQLDLRGPSLAVQTACSTSLVAVHLACQSLIGRECDMALAGGVSIEVPHARGYLYREGEILSRDGHCRAFDAAASGTVFSSGVGIVVLRRLEDAIADRDTINAVILGSAVNNDGQRKVGYLAPSVAGQAEAIAEALGVANVEADSISYVETHGTGTAVGDPLEIKGLTQAFRGGTSRNGFCGIGSLKTNVGHLDAAAGVAGLIKTVLALRNRQLPASLHFQQANPQIDLENSPFYVNSTLAPWRSDGKPRRAGVTSLGIGGTNAHVVLEEAPERVRSESRFPHQVILLSARTETALESATSRLAAHLGENPDLRMADVAFTSQAGRKAFRHRRFVVARTTAEAARLLAAEKAPRGFKGEAAAPSSSSVVFLFSGQGSQYPTMGADLYASEPIFRAHVDRCADELLPHLGRDLRGLLYPSADDAASAAIELNRTSITQPALFALEYSLAQWWMAMGIRPQAMLGHSIGEYVAACLADVLSLEDALAITAIRGRLMESCMPGSMLAVSMSRQGLVLSADLWLAAVNAPEQCVVSGSDDAIARLEQRLTDQGVSCRRLRTSHAFHSAMMEPILESFRARISKVSLRQPRVPYLSNLTGTWITPAEATDPGYWANHLRHTVRFSECVAELLRQPGRFLIEVGPGQALADLVRQHMSESATGASAKVFSTLRRRDETVGDTGFLLEALGRLWVGGQSIDWSALYRGDDVSRIPLPTYPFERRRFWIEPDSTPGLRDQQPLARLLTSDEATAGNSHERAESTCQGCIDHWFHERVWRRVSQPAHDSSAPASWMVFLDPTGLGREISLQLKGRGHEVVEIALGSRFKRNRRGQYAVRPGVREDYDALFADLGSRKFAPQKIVHLWSIRAGLFQPSLNDRLDRSFYSLLYLAQAIGERDMAGIDLAVVSDRIHSINGEPVCDPVCATLLGPTKVIPKEFPGITCRGIDVDLSSRRFARLAVQVIAEQSAPFCDSAVAIRHGERFIEGLEHRDRGASLGLSRFRQKGVYLITGGLGDLGLVIAFELARQLQARLVLVGRTSLPPAQERESALASTSTPDRVKEQIRKVREIESLGAEVLTLRCDVCERDQVASSIETALARFGAINGVIHAAGVIEDGAFLTKSRESAARVLDPKVRGTLVLCDVLDKLVERVQHDLPLDFIALFSSVSSVLAPAGQVDYAASNAFLDAFATSRHDGRVVGINWGPWRDVGMAARSSIAHPLLGRCLVDTGDEIIYSAALSRERHWVLAEHCLKDGKAVFPGTGYLEMATAALTHGSFDRGVEFEDVFFQSPLSGDLVHAREAQVELRRGSDDVFQFSVRARQTGWIEHASGRIARCRRQPPADRALDIITARCQSRQFTFDESRRTRQETFFDFGPRWRCLKAIHVGENEALAELELAAAYGGDTSAYHLHPALLDLATGSALYLIDDYGESSDLYFPMFYKRAIIYRRLPSKFVSHIRSRQRNEAGRDLATFDFTLLDDRGRVLAEIEGFSMRMVRDRRDGLGVVEGNVAVSSVQDDLATEGRGRGIVPAEGAMAFMRIVSSDGPPNVFVLPDGPPAMARAIDSTVRPVMSKAPRDDTAEAVLTGWWLELLGTEHISLDDDFFELGGQSLLVVRLFSKIKKRFGVNLGLSTFFDARTIRKLAQLIREASAKDNPGPLSRRVIVPIQPNGTRPPLYLMSGLDGHVLMFQRMAFHLGEDQPVHGLVPRVLDNGEPGHTCVEDMAAYYVEAIRKAQPEGPYRLAGHSFGGIVAFEVAQQLVARGGVVSLLGLFDTIERGYSEQVRKSFGLLQRLDGYMAELKFAILDRDPFGPLRRHFRRKAPKRLQSILKRPSRPDLHAHATIKDTNLRAYAAYEPEPYPAALTLFRSTLRGPGDGEDEFLGWGKFVSGALEVHEIPSTHFNMIDEPAVRILSEKLKECLDRDPALGGPVSRSSAKTFEPDRLTRAGRMTTAQAARQMSTARSPS